MNIMNISILRDYYNIVVYGWTCVHEEREPPGRGLNIWKLAESSEYVMGIMKRRSMNENITIRAASNVFILNYGALFFKLFAAIFCFFHKTVLRGSSLLLFDRRISMNSRRSEEKTTSGDKMKTK